MLESVSGFLETLYGDSFFGRYFAIFLLSMLPAISGPVIAIPFGAALGLPAIPTTLAAILGNVFPVPFVILFIRKIFAWMRKKSAWLGKVADKFENKAKAKGDRFRRGVFFGLLLFVAVPLPLPGMGAWTGSLIAAIINIRLKIALPAIGLGVVIASIIAASVTYGIISLVTG